MKLKFGILAHPAGHSLSPAMFNAAFKFSGINAEYSFFDVPPANLKKFIDKYLKSSSPLNGLSVSFPYKETIMQYLDEVDEAAEIIGAVNTITCEDGKIKGTNTDYIGFMQSVGNLTNKKVVIIGAGGAARAIAYALLTEGNEVIVLNRTIDKAKKLADDLNEYFPDKILSGDILKVGGLEFDAIVQATSVWFTEGLDAKIVPDKFYEKITKMKKKPLAFDVVYKPRMTPLLEKMSELGCKIVTGDEMLLNQAIQQYKLWTNLEAPIDVMRKELEKNL